MHCTTAYAYDSYSQAILSCRPNFVMSTDTVNIYTTILSKKPNLLQIMSNKRLKKKADLSTQMERQGYPQADNIIISVKQMLMEILF